MKLTQKLKAFLPNPIVCIFYLMASLTFCYIYFHKTFFFGTFYENNIGGIYPTLNYEARVPNQFRLLIPYLFTVVKTFFPFLSDKVAYFSMILFMAFLTLIIFYNILNEYFDNKNINSYLALILFYPALWHYTILNQMFDFTDVANMLFIFAGYLLVIKGYDKTLILVFTIGTFNHDSIGFCILMYLLFNYRKLFTAKIIINTAIMSFVIIAVKLTLAEIFRNNPGPTWRPNYLYNVKSFSELPLHIVFRNIFLFFGGLHFFVFYFIVSGKWKLFKTKYFYISLTLIPYVMIVFLIHTTHEARNYITAIPYIIVPFLLLLATQKNSFLKPTPKILSHKDYFVLTKD